MCLLKLLTLLHSNWPSSALCRQWYKRSITPRVGLSVSNGRTYVDYTIGPEIGVLNCCLEFDRWVLSMGLRFITVWSVLSILNFKKTIIRVGTKVREYAVRTYTTLDSAVADLIYRQIAQVVCFIMHEWLHSQVLIGLTLRVSSEQGCARDLPSRDRDRDRDETETRRCSFRDAGRDLEAPETLESFESFNVSPRRFPWSMVKHIKNIRIN